MDKNRDKKWTEYVRRGWTENAKRGNKLHDEFVSMVK